VIVVPRTTEKYERVIPLGGISFCRYSTQKKWSKVPLFLTNTMVVYILQGQKIIHNSGEDIYLSPGDGFIARKGAHIFSEILEGDEPFESILWYCDDSWLLEIFKELKTLPLPPQNWGAWTWKANPRLTEILQTSLPYFDTEGVPPKLLRNRFTEILWNLAQQEDGALALSALQNFGRLQPSVLDVLEEHFTLNLHISDLARLAGRSVASLVRDVRAMTKTSPRQWIIQRRLQQAKTLLLGTEKTITQIGHELGFSSSAHFTSQFHKHYGLPPREFRPRF
jgi:AraC family transcriptional regulator, exoenzyme S synthesis regulatory protein ExsA